MRSSRRQRQVERVDAEELVLAELEEMLEENVRYWWRRTREMLGHEGWTFYADFELETWCGCDCNRYNRWELEQAIARLRRWRDRREFGC